MPIDWEQFEQDVDIAIVGAGERTDQELASRVSSVTSLTDDEVQAMLPEPGDVKKFAELMTIVNSAEERNVKVQRIVDNAEQFGGVMLTLLSKFA